MIAMLAGFLNRTRNRLAVLLLNPGTLAFVPPTCLAAYWLGGETGLLCITVALSVLFLVVLGKTSGGSSAMQRHALRGLIQPDAYNEILRTYFSQSRDSGMKSVVFSIELDEHQELAARYGDKALDTVTEVTGNRVISVFREGDAVVLTRPGKLGVCLSPVSYIDLEMCIQLAARVQAIVEEPVPLDGTTLYVTASIGFCENAKIISQSSEKWMVAADHALAEAQQNGPNAIRAYSDEMRKKSQTRAALRDEVVRALEEGQIRPWFQPQISTDTGLVTGFEALARWNHPNRGMVPPAAFLPAIEEAGLLERLAETMMYHSLTALKAWDSAGMNVPQVGVNFAGPELSNPKLVEKIKWQLDRFDLAPERLSVEVLETVVAGAPDDTITRNINGLGKLGCRIDLDDFGTGHASIASIRRFSVSRIKIDRSFVMKADRDPEQQRMISAILTMAERLEVETLAEGVETVGEHALLAQLGCNHVQGFGIGKPMPFDQTLDWISQHNAKLQATPKILGGKPFQT